MNAPVAEHHEQLEGIAADCSKMLLLLPEVAARRGITENCAESIALRARLESVIQRCIEEREASQVMSRTLPEIDDELSAISKAAQLLFPTV